jgi:hypothetical protein
MKTDAAEPTVKNFVKRLQEVAFALENPLSWGTEQKKEPAQ